MQCSALVVASHPSSPATSWPPASYTHTERAVGRGEFGSQYFELGRHFLWVFKDFLPDRNFWKYLVVSQDTVWGMSCCVEMRTDCGAHCCDQFDAAVPIRRSNSRAAGRVPGPARLPPLTLFYGPHTTVMQGGGGRRWGRSGGGELGCGAFTHD